MKKNSWLGWDLIHGLRIRVPTLYFFFPFVKGQCMHMWWKLDFPEQTLLRIEKVLREYQVRNAVTHLPPVVLTLTSENGPLGSRHPC